MRRACPLVTCALLAACTKPLIASPIEARSDGWTIRLERMHEGGNSPPVGATPITPGTIYTPDDGQRFVHVFLKVRNDTPARRVFNYGGCDLDVRDVRAKPSVIVSYSGIAREMPPTEAYNAGEDGGRWLIYSLPEHVYPTSLECQGTVIDFPPLQVSEGNK